MLFVEISIKKNFIPLKGGRMKLFKIMCVMALVLAVSAIAYAETQSVKVSGDITLRAFARDNYDLNNDDAPTIAGAASNTGVAYTDTPSAITTFLNRPMLNMVRPTAM